MQSKTERSQPNSIVLSAEGVWTHGGVAFTNRNLIALFSRSLRRAPNGEEYELRVGQYQEVVIVEDTAWFITSVETSTAPWLISVSDGTSETLDPKTLCFGGNNQLYCQIRHNSTTPERARFTRSAFQLIVPFFDQTGALNIGPQKVIISTSEGAPS